MKGRSKAKLRPGQDEAIGKVDELVSILEKACQLALLRDGRGCAELQDALEVANGVRSDLSSTDISESKWKRITWTLEFILKVATRFCSFINCEFPRGRIYAHWVNHKKVA